MFKPLRLPLDLHPYHLYSFEYLPRFYGEDHVTTERHLEAFEKFVDQFEIIHGDVTMRLFSHASKSRRPEAMKNAMHSH
jgi:hypothetical protein